MGRRRKAMPAIGGVPVKFWAIYAHGPASTKYPLTIAYSDRPQKKLPDGHIILASAWTVDWRLARRVVRRCEGMLTLTNSLDHLTVEWAKRLIPFAAHTEGVPLYSNGDVARLMVPDEQRRFNEMLRNTGIMGINRAPQS